MYEGKVKSVYRTMNKTCERVSVALPLEICGVNQKKMAMLCCYGLNPQFNNSIVLQTFVTVCYQKISELTINKLKKNVLFIRRINTKTLHKYAN